MPVEREDRDMRVETGDIMDLTIQVAVGEEREALDKQPHLIIMAATEDQDTVVQFRVQP